MRLIGVYVFTAHLGQLLGGLFTSLDLARSPSSSEPAQILLIQTLTREIPVLLLALALVVWAAALSRLLTPKERASSP
jgi:hypothetical protein